MNQNCTQLAIHPKIYKALALFFIFLLPILAGCFETDFKFETTINQDGSVVRRTQIDGRGASLFKAPEGDGWQSKSWETKGQAALLPDAQYHILSDGKFSPAQNIPSDFEFDLSKHLEKWGEDKSARLEEAGILEPIEEHLYSRNHVQVQKVLGWFANTLIYEEIFETRGVLELLRLDLRDEIRNQTKLDEPELSDEELDARATAYLENEVLPKITFRSEVNFPGKIISANTKQTKGNKAVWSFSMQDFEEDSSRFVLRSVSRVPKPTTYIYIGLVGLILLGAFGMLLLGFLKAKKQKKSSKKKAE